MVLPNSEPSITSSAICRTKVNYRRSNYLWIIDDFKAVHFKRGVSINSLPFSADDDKFGWYLNLNPKGDNSSNINLFLHTKGDLSKLTPISGIFKASIMNAENRPMKTQKMDFTIANNTNSYVVIPSFVERNYLFTEANQLLPQDRLTISCEVSYIKKTDIIDIPVESFSISREEDQFTGLEDIETLYMDEEFADVTLCVNGKDYPAHKSILAARSSHFKTALQIDMKEKKSNRIELDKISVPVFEEILRFIYAGKVPNLETLVSELLEAADRFNLEKLKNICVKEMLKNVTNENVIDVLVLGDRHNAPDLKRGAIQFIKTNSYSTNILTNEIREDLVKSCPHILLEILDVFFSPASIQQGN